MRATASVISIPPQCLWRQHSAIWLSVARDCDYGAYNLISVCFTQPAEYGVPNSLLPARLPALTNDGCAHVCEEILVPLQWEMSANVLRRGLSHTTSDCEMSSVAAILPPARAGEIN